MPENEINDFAKLALENQTQVVETPTPQAEVETPVQEVETPETEVAQETVTPTETPTETAPEQDDTDDVLAILNGEQPKETVAKEFDYSAFKDVLGKEVKSTEEIKEAINSYKEAASNYEKQLSSLPPELRTAMELAQNGGDYLAALGVAQIDYNQIPASDFVRTMFPNTPEGEEKFNEFIENTHPSTIDFQGAQLRNQAIQRQQAELNYIRTQSIERKQANENAIRKELDGMQNFLGNKVTPSDRQKVYDALSKGLAGEYKRPDGTIDAKRAVTEKMIIALAPTLIKNAKHKGVTEGATRVVTQAANVQLNKTTPIQQFTQPIGSKNPLESYLASLEANG